MRKRIQFLLTFFIILLFVGTLSSFSSGYRPTESCSEETLTKSEYENTISEPSGKSLELLGQYDENIGVPKSLFVEENFLYILSDTAGLIKMDISDSTRPNILGINKSATNWECSEFFVKDSILYYLDGHHQIVIVNITDFNNLVELEGIETFSYSQSMKIYGNLLIIESSTGYVFIDQASYISIYDISNPTNVVLLNLFNFTHLNSYQKDFEYFDDTLYITANQENYSILVIYDVTNISNPVYLGNYTTAYNSNYQNIIVDELTAYVINGSELHVFNVTNLSTPTFLDSIILPHENNYWREIKLVEDSLYITNSSAIITLDASNNLDIQIVDMDIVSGYLRDFTIKDSYLFIIDSTYSELLTYDLITPHNPQKANTFYFGGNCKDICVDKKIAYIANSYNGTQILDISDPKNPRLIGLYADGDSIDSVQVSGQILYATSFEKCLKLIDISDPSNPILLSEYRSENNYANYLEAKVSKNKVYLVHRFAGLEIIDVTDSSNPTLLGSYTDDFILNIKLKNNFLLIGMRDLRILDVSDPTDIQLVSSLSFEGDFVTDIALEGNRAYLLSSYWGIERIRVVNVANPNRPKNIGSTRIDSDNINNIDNIEVSGDYLYLTSFHEGLIVLKNTFDRLSYVGQSSDENNCGLNLVVEKGFVYMASGYEGLSIFDAFTSVKLTTIIIIIVVIAVVVIVAVLIFRIIKTRRR
ncbi:MAG: LVIVD repeat-containing protein [Candidatus Heimdallarchaeota archaeon]